MEPDLEDHLKQHGLGKRWVWLLGSLGISTLPELQSRLHTVEFQNAMFDHVKAKEVENLSNLFQQGSVVPEGTQNAGALTQLLQRDRDAIAHSKKYDNKDEEDEHEVYKTKQFWKKENTSSASLKDQEYKPKAWNREENVPSSRQKASQKYAEQVNDKNKGWYYRQDEMVPSSSQQGAIPKHAESSRDHSQREDKENDNLWIPQKVSDTAGVTSMFEKMAERESTMKLLEDENLTGMFDKLLQDGSKFQGESPFKDAPEVTSEFEKLFHEDKVRPTPKKKAHSLSSEDQRKSSLTEDNKRPMDSRDSLTSEKRKTSKETEDWGDSHNISEEKRESLKFRDRKDSHKSQESRASNSRDRRDSHKSQESRASNSGDRRDPEKSRESDNRRDSHDYEDEWSESSISTEVVRVPERRDSQKPDDGSCLGHYLLNIGLDHYGNKFINERIQSLEDLQNIFCQEDQLARLVNNTGLNKGYFQEVLESTLTEAVAHEQSLKRLGLIKYFPEKITLQKVMEKSVDKLETVHDVPWYFLSKILMLDHRVRDDLLPENMDNTSETEQSLSSKENVQLEDVLDDMFSKLIEDTSEASNVSGPHPLDVLTLIFQCSSNFLRQIICEKMFMCKLGIPLVLPQFLHGKRKLLLWSLRNVILEVNQHDEVSLEKSAVSCSLPILSCLKVGTVMRSKSRLLNEILNGQSHDTFFHRDCKNGMMNKRLSDGMIEIALYLSLNKKTERGKLNTTLAVLNLRGCEKSNDANNKFLIEISNIILVMANITELNTSAVLSFLKSLASSGKELILMISKDANTKFDVKCKEAIKSCVKNIECENFKYENIILDFTISGEKNIKELKEETVTKINKSLERSMAVNALESYKGLADSLDIAIDENTPNCIINQGKVIELIQDIKKGNIENAKMEFLPLQCGPWKEWAKLNKEEHRLKKKPKGSVADYIGSLHTKKEEKRNEQRQYLEKPSKLFKAFLQILTQNQGDNLDYYLKWMKIYLDDISRETIPGLNREYSIKWDETCKFENNEIPKNLQEELKKLETKIAESSFGLEHIMREIGQAYEAHLDASEEFNSQIRGIIESLPKIVANMLLSGYPLELMDGDASHVPIQWVKAVLQELGKLIGEDKKVFVLSVLGIQSSGKSTLLNTMFGLQFAVAAGRCTRGVYAQLVPVCKENQDMNYDYILVVDTEGLRAAELGAVKLEHDNEIATLVIGIGDVTIINIKGENVAEMEDVLQIVVHAILKMKLVNKSLKLQPSCIFIHQNVSAPDAAQKMKTGQQKFLESLDKVTKAAGQQEDKPDYCKVKQVIDIDINKNIWYFSDLWKGDPPMAPANYGYSEKVNAVKQQLLQETMRQRAYQFTIPKLCIKLEDLWNGILKENFVFSFKNSLEIKAYRSLETIRSDLSWTMRNSALKWLNNKSITIQSCENDLDSLDDSLIVECDRYLREEYGKVETSLKEFFENSEEKEMLEQWRTNSLLKLKESYEEILSKTKKRLRNAVKMRRRQADQAQDSQKYKEEMLSCVTKLADDCRNEQNMGTEFLEDRFNQMWIEWVRKLLSDCDKDEVNIYESVKNVLLNEFNMDQSLLLKSLDKFLLLRIKKNFLFAIENHISDEVPQNVTVTRRRTTTSSKPIKEPSFEGDLPSGQHRQQERRNENVKKANRIIEELIEKVTSDVENLELQGFNENYAKSVIELVNKMVDEMENSSVLRTSMGQLRIHLSVCASQLASYKFSRKHKKETEEPRDTTNLSCKIDDIEVLPIFRNVLHEEFPEKLDVVSDELGKCCMPIAGNASDFVIDLEAHITIEKNLLGKNKISEAFCKKAAEAHVANLLEKVKSCVEESNMEGFKDESAETIIKTVSNMLKETENSKQNFHFTKTFKTEISIHACLYAIPKFFEKHRRYIENIDPRLRFERNYKETYLEMFKNLYKKSGNEKAFADILSQHLCKVIVNTVDKDMPRKLADAVRCNVEEVQRKSSLLPAVLGKLLDVDTFQEYQLYLNDLLTCLDKWIAYYINNYIFKLERSGRTRYVTIAASALKSLIGEVCGGIEKAAVKVLRQKAERASFQLWLKEFQRLLYGELPIVENDIASLADGYNIVDLSLFAETLKSNINASFEKLLNIFNDHREAHLSSAHEDSVYSLISQECQGCTEKCPFCNAPCSMSEKDHIKQSMNHTAIEHYPLACAGIRWGDDNTLLIENCSVQVAGDEDFENKDTDFQPHPYKKYKKIYPDWEIDGDVSVEASLYWKRFLVKYGSHLADKYLAEPPEIPQAWRTITRERVRKSLNRATAFDHLQASSTC